MPRYRPIKLYGNTYVITLTREDIKDFNKKIGDEVDVENILKKKKDGKKE
jgi:hypothetical protein